jgi:hypothetical protein
VTWKRPARLIKCTRIEDDCLHDFWRSRNNATTRNAAVINKHSKRHKGEMMKKHPVRILFAFFAFAALANTAKGQTVDQIVVKIPYEFVVDGKTLPAGSYRINRADYNNNRELVISNSENRAAVFILPIEVGDNTRDEQPKVSFQLVGDQHVLSRIETGEHVFSIPVSSPAVLEAAMKRHIGSSGSENSGSN